MEQVALRAQELAVERTGTGAENVVLLHGFQNDHRAWQALVDRLDEDRFAVTAVDLVGCGGSSRPASWERCTIDEYAADLVALCEALAITAPILVGHSLGAGIALRAALDHSTLFRALVLVAPVSTSGLDPMTDEAFGSLCRPTPQQQQDLARAAFRQPPPKEDFERLLEVLALATAEHIEGAARSMRDLKLIEELPHLAIPSVLICGDRDRHVRLRHHLATQQAIRRCGLQVYFDIGHVPFQETPDQFASDLLRFVQTLH